MATMEKASVCPMDCPDTCSLAVTVEDNRVVKVRGSRVNPITQGVLCNKVARYYPEFVHGEERLSVPLKRAGAKGAGDFVEIGWDEALDTIRDRFQDIIGRYGPQAILPFNYAGPHGMLSGDSMSARFFHKLGATLLSRRPLCGGIKDEAYRSVYGAVPGMPMQQISLAKLVVVWGNNVTVSNLHLMSRINEAKRNGAKVVVVDPKRIKVAEQADLFLPIRPGTDVVLAWAIAAELERTGGLDHNFIAANVDGFQEFMALARDWTPDRAAEECGIPADDIRTLADWYKHATPAAICYGNGLERNRNGGSGIRAIAALPALAGKFGIPGGGLLAAAGYSFPKTGDKLQRPDLALEDDLDPPIRGLFIYNHNPVIVHPDQNRMKRALAREDLFTVGCEVAMTDSMAYCDIVLPAATHFEHADLFCAYGQQYLQRAEAVIPPYGKALPNTEIFRRLAARFGFDGPVFTASDTELMADALDGADPRLKGYRPSDIPTDAAIGMAFDGAEPVLFQNVFPKTPSGKAELASDSLGERFGARLPSYVRLEGARPLTLITPSSDKRISSTFGGVKDCDATPFLDIHPADAAARGLDDGAMVRVWNELGEVHLPLRITDAVRPGVVCSAKGAWFKTAENGQTVSALAPATKADIAEGACYNDTRVEVAAFPG
jgi:anaerobic selenocysteine-containing dehydrogenase